MKYLFIKFPFSSVNDEKYVLTICLHNPATLQDVINALDAETEVFTAGATEVVGSDTVYNYTGRLTGSVTATDDDRDDVYEPMVASKLQFNIAVQNFPEWLMLYCDMRWASVILYKNNATKREMWRGYLIAQSLNMTVVNNILACSMVAVDEIAMAKYMQVNKNITSGVHTLSLQSLIEAYHSLHFDRGFRLNGQNGIGFGRLYELIGLTQSGKILWHRDMAITDDGGNEIDNLPSKLVVNIDRWLHDDAATWHDMFDSVLRFLGVTFCIGSWDGLTSNDGYIFSCPTDSGTVKQYEIYIGSWTTELQTSQFDTLSNPQKINADLQMTVEPNRYKTVTVESKPERWETHEYLKEKDYPRVDETKEIRYMWGTTDDQDNGPFNEYGWHKMVYIKPTTDEQKYVQLPACQDGEGKVMAGQGVLPYDNINSCNGLTQPTSAVADSLDFITFKEGATCIKIGGGTIGGIDEDKSLKPYFIILNHMWSNMWSRLPYTMQNTHIADTTFLTLTPFADAGPTHPSEKHFLRLKMRVKFIRENMSIGSNNDSSPKKWLWLPSPGVGQSMRAVTWARPAILLPCEDSAYPDFEETDSAFTGHLDSWNSLSFTAVVRVGNHWWNGSAWVTSQATCTISLYSDTNEITEVDKYGARTITTKNYYYTFASPWMGDTTVNRTNDPQMLVDCNGVSKHNSPLQGQMSFQILGQVHFQNSAPGTSVYNSVPFILIDGIDIGWTDLSEQIDEDISNTASVNMDYYSETKEVMTRSLAMASPNVPGFFNNVLVYDGGDKWHNLTEVISQGGSVARKPEQMLATKLAELYGEGKCFVEFSTPVQYDDNVYNVDFSVVNLVETEGKFMPVKREYNFVRETMRVKLMRVNINRVNTGVVG